MELQDDLDGLPMIAVDDVRPGDLVFTARPGRLQTLSELAGDPWRHVGVAAVVDGDMCCCEVAGHMFQFRPIRRIAAPPHTAVGVARLAASQAGCSSAAAAWVTRMLAEQNLYAWDDLILTGLLLLVRRRAPAMFLDEVMAVIESAERVARTSPPPADQRSFTCASFAYHAFAQAGFECTPNVTIEPVRTRPGRFRDEVAVQPRPLAELMAEVEAGNLDALVGPLAEFSLLELSGAMPDQEGPRTRISATSRMSADQFVATARNLVRIVADVHTVELPARLVVDERWVSPGDLWRLDNLELRALLPIVEPGPGE